MIEYYDVKQLSDYISLHQKAFGMEPWNEKWSYEDSMSRLIDIQNTPRFLGLVYKDGTKTLGVLMGNVEQMNGYQQFFLKEMFVHDNYMNRGIGKLLLDALDNVLKATSVTEIMLFTSYSNGTNQFYEKCLFSAIEEYGMMKKDVIV